WVRRLPSVGRLPRVEPALGAVDVLPGAGLRVLVDLGRGAGPVDLRDAVRAEQHEAPVVDLVVEAVERADGRTGGAVALLVVLPAVARTAESARRNHRDDRHGVGDPLHR